jgi:hypothetical protein
VVREGDRKGRLWPVEKCNSSVETVVVRRPVRCGAIVSNKSRCCCTALFFLRRLVFWPWTGFLRKKGWTRFLWGGEGRRQEMHSLAGKRTLALAFIQCVLLNTVYTHRSCLRHGSRDPAPLKVTHSHAPRQPRVHFCPLTPWLARAFSFCLLWSLSRCRLPAPRGTHHTSSDLPRCIFFAPQFFTVFFLTSLSSSP